MTTNGTGGKLCFNYCWDLEQNVVLKTAEVIKEYDYCYTHTLVNPLLFSQFLEFQLVIDTDDLNENRLTSLQITPKVDLFNGSPMEDPRVLSDSASTLDSNNPNFDQVIRMIYANEYTGNHDAFEIFNPLTTTEYITDPISIISEEVVVGHNAYEDADDFYQAMVNHLSDVSGNPTNQLTSDEMNGTVPIDLDRLDREISEICFFIKLKGFAKGPDGSTNVHTLEGDVGDGGSVIKINLIKSN